MTGVVTGCLACLAVTILAAGVFIGLALNSLALALAVTAGAFCGMGLLGAWAVLRGRFRFPGPRPLTGWRLTAAVLLALACATGCVVTGFHGLLTLTVALALAAVALAGRCAVAELAERRCPHQDYWKDHDEAILQGDLTTGAWERARQAGERR